MPSKHLAELTDKSLAEGEDRDDLWWMTDELVKLRAPTNPDPETNESVAARLLCWVVVFKPEHYLAAMHSFRLSFKGVSAEGRLQERFRQSVRPAALRIRRPEDVIFRADLYFEPEERPPEPRTMRI